MTKNKKETAVIKNTASSSASSQSKYITVAILISLYLGVDFIPEFGSIDVMGTQWFYLAIVNLIISSYIFLNAQRSFKGVLRRVSKNSLSLCYIALFIVCGISVLFAINRIESLVVYARFVVTIIAFFNIGILIYGRLTSMKYLCQIISIIVLIQCVPILFSFLREMGTIPIDNLILELKGHSGNKNILAASLIVKLPFVIYCISNFSGLWRNLINITTLGLVDLLIFILNARAAYIALFLQILLYLIFFITYNYKKIGVLKASYNCLRVILPITVAFIISQALLSRVEISNSTGYGTINKRLSSITSNYSGNERIFFWKNAIDYIKVHPLIGCGYGNWKIASLPYEKTHINDFEFSKHVHNDFLELTAESGIPAGVLFIAIFVFALIYNIKLWYSSASEDVKFIGVFSLISLVGYFIDAFFNFPGERPVMQIFFAFTLAINVAVFINSSNHNEKIYSGTAFKAVIFLIVFTLISTSLYITYNTLKSMQVQSYTHFDIGKDRPNMTWQQVNSKFPEIPNLAASNMPIDVIKAWYLFKDNQYQDALSLLNKSTNVNPNSMVNEWLKASIFSSVGEVDSAIYYAKKGFLNRPKNILLYNLVSRLSARKNDVETIKKSYQEFHRYRSDTPAWTIYIKNLFMVNYNQREMLSLVDSMSNLYPHDLEIQYSKCLVHGHIAYAKGDFSIALKNFKEIYRMLPEDYENMENIGLTYFFLKDYANAAMYFEKVIRARFYNNGKSEFYYGLSLHNLGKKTEGCQYMSIAVSKNYPTADQYFKFNCK